MQVLTQHIVLMIMAVVIAPSSEEEDMGFWMLTSNGEFSMKTAYDAQTIIIFPKDNHWKQVWKITSFRRIQIFIWRTMHDSLPTLASLLNKNLETSASYSRCDNTDETILHTLRDYGPSRNLWL